MQDGRTPGFKLLMAILIAAFLSIPLFAVYRLIYDRQSQSTTASASIAAGWGGPQVFAGPLLAIPYEQQVLETVNENSRSVQHSRLAQRELVLSPDTLDLTTDVMPQQRRKSIYVAVVYEAQGKGSARFLLPADLARSGVTPDQLHYDRAELRIGLSDARGLYGPPPLIVANGQPLRLQPGHGPAEAGGSGFFAFLDAVAIRTAPVAVSFRLGFRGNGSLSLAPAAGDTRWRRGGYLAALLTGLYAVLYVLLSLEAYSLLIGSILLFAALAAIMYLTRNIDWGGLSRRAPSPDGTV